MMTRQNIVKTGMGLTVAMSIAIASLIQPWEGKKNTPYRDVGGIWTVCYGHTGSDIIVGKIYSDAECDALLGADVKVAERAVNRWMHYPVSDKTKASFISFVYNVGEVQFKASSLLRLANGGEIEAACNQLSRWVYVKGVKVKGLENRRISERALCLEGIGK